MSRGRRARLGRCALYTGLAICAATALLGTRWAWYPWPFELLVHWPEVWGTALVGGTAIALSRRRRLLALVGAGALLAGALPLAPYLLPREPLAAAEPESSARRLRLLVANVWCERAPTPALAELVRREAPDLFAVIELTPTWLAALEELADLLPHRVTAPREDPFGLALFSRWPLESLHVGPVGVGGYELLLARVAHPAGALSLAVAHPRAPQHPLGWYGRNDYLAAVAEHLRAAPAPRLLAADSNATPWSGPMRTLAARTGLVDARSGRGWLGTWPTFLPSVFLRPIDHVLHEPAMRVLRFAVTESFGSDHRGLAVELLLPR